MLLGIIISCQRELRDVGENEDSEILKAREWYENNFSSEVSLKSTDLTKGKIKIKPYWGYAFYRKHQGFQTFMLQIIDDSPEQLLAAHNVPLTKSDRSLLVATREAGVPSGMSE
jgi:hypothetical protein